MNKRYGWSKAWLLTWLLLAPGASAQLPLPVDVQHEYALGLHTHYLQESNGPLTLQQALAAYEDGKFAPGNHEALNFGIGAKPVWVHLALHNGTGRLAPRQLSVETPWLDRVDIYFRHDDRTVANYTVGDRLPFADRPSALRYFAIDYEVPPGVTEVFLRIETPDPMVLPIYLLTQQQAVARERTYHYTYGILYGFLSALLAYNLMLYAGLRHRRYVLYSLYLGMFLLMNLAYTGHAFQWLWPQATVWTQWANPLLIVVYGVSGLVFARCFLDTKLRFPRVDRTVVVYIVASVVVFALASLLGRRDLALLVAFGFIFLFSIIMLGLGVLAVRGGQVSARYFLLAAFTAMLGAASTALSTWGFLPFNVWTFRAVEMGIMLDATLLALALTYQIRQGEQQRLQAQQLATLDPLTGINNRRAFYDQTAPIWNATLRHGRDLAVILLDIDYFKRINDAHGHAFGDRVLVATSEVLTKTVRGQDVVARWGGEEFILVLPETGLEEATALAERLRHAIAQLEIDNGGDQVQLTASFGVAQRQRRHKTLEAVISTADQRLYLSKSAGRNRVTAA